MCNIHSFSPLRITLITVCQQLLLLVGKVTSQHGQCCLVCNNFLLCMTAIVEWQISSSLPHEGRLYRAAQLWTPTPHPAGAYRPCPCNTLMILLVCALWIPSGISAYFLHAAALRRHLKRFTDELRMAVTEEVNTLVLHAITGGLRRATPDAPPQVGQH